MKTLLIHMTTPPYAGLTASDGLDFALAAVNYGHQPVLLFEGDGVLQLVTAQEVPEGTRNHTKRVSACPLYDIDELYVRHSSLAARGLSPDALLSAVEIIHDDDIASLLSGCDFVVTF